MKILVVLPNWLGDAVMATPAIELLCEKYKDVKLTFVGSFVAIEALKYHPKCEAFFIDETKKESNRFLATYKLAKKLGSFDLGVTFRNQLHSSLLLFFSSSTTTIAKKSWHASLFVNKTVKELQNSHLVEKYAHIVSETKPSSLKLYIEAKKSDKPLLGINAGATYGSAKRWSSDRFAEVAVHFSDRYNIVLFGGPNEVEIVNEIQKLINTSGVKNVTNLAGKTTIKELCENIASLDLFVTNDSGPMHVAAAYQIPTLSIFGPTKFKETSQWMNPKGTIVRHDIECSPCMKRECPIKTHECMVGINSTEVIEVIEKELL
ncbi:MAG: lipopolysaccharide heptosyltransferase II [Helicobacteraceae bacterium]|nr:lipopolysaccharide heptosyltransferase II [Helicobacteraceae bacterium]